jgi:hypothetical protein
MPDSACWDVIFGSGSRQIVLIVDFPAARRREAGFCELARSVGGYRFLQTRPPAARSCQRLAGDAYVGPWIDGIEQDRHQVLAVLGRGIGGVYAAAIAEGISRLQQMPEVILFDPQPASIEHLGLEFRRELSDLASLLNDEEIERTTRMTDEITGSAACDVADAASRMAGIYCELCSLAYERVGLGDDDGKYITSFDSYMSWLSAAGQIDPSPIWRHSTAIVSADYAGPGGGGAEEGDDLPIGRKISFDIAQADLLRSDSVAQALVGLLGASSAPESGQS